jgi:transglutaminase-like putative cysteine protease
VSHTTRYEYELPVVHAHHLAHLRPRTLPHQALATSRLEISPEPEATRGGLDYFGNPSEAIEVLTSHDLFEVRASSEVNVLPRGEVPPGVSRSFQECVARLRGEPELCRTREFSFESPLVRLSPELRSYAEQSFLKDTDLVTGVLDLNARIHHEFRYEPAVTDVTTPLSRVLREKRGVCQDFAQLAIGCLRALGLAARYHSGYLETDPPPGRPRLTGADASHAWAAVFIPDYGWMEFDPTNNALPEERHVTLAWGRDFGDVSPLRGVVLGGGQHRVVVGVDVVRLDSEPPA